MSRRIAGNREPRLECLERRLALSADIFLTMNTTYGSFQVELFNSVAPNTVANFLRYVNINAFNDSIFHLSVPGFVLEGGNYRTSSSTLTSNTQFTQITSQGTIASEAGIPNTAGTLGMALTNGPNSATDEWYINLADNTKLDGSAAGGPYTVFGKVLGDGMQVVDKMSSLPTVNMGGDLTNLPVDLAHGSELAQITSITVDSGITGLVFNDANANGAFDVGETGIAGQVVYLDANNNGVLDPGEVSTVTDANGFYNFTGIAPGSYVVREVLLPNHGIAVTTSTDGAQITVLAGNASQGPNFGNVQISTIAPLPVSAASLPHGVDANTAFIEALYVDLLGHAADPTGLAAWQSLMANGANRVQVALDIWNSPEHRGIEVDQYYETFFGRQADPGGHAFWIDAFNHGADERVVVASLLSSSEYRKLHPDDASFIGALYFDVFERAPDQGGLTAWLTALQKGGQTQLDAAVAFVVANESSARIVDGFFAAFLHRSAGADRSIYLNALDSNSMTVEGIGVAMLASDEFLADAIAASQG